MTNIYDTVSSIIDVEDFSELDVIDLYNRTDGNITIRKGNKNYKILQSYRAGAGFLEDCNVILCDFSDNNIIYKISSRNGISEIDLSSNNVDLSDYYTKSEIDSNNFATETFVTTQGYLTEHQSLTDYYTKSEVNDVVDSKFWSGTQAEWDALTDEQKNSYTIAMIEI